MASPPRRHPLPPTSPPPRPSSRSSSLEADITVVSAKHLKNVNWRRGDLKPCVVFHLDPELRMTTKSDDSGSTSPVWNERFVLPVPHGDDVTLTVEIFHSKPSETSKTLVGTASAPFWDLIDNFPDTRGGSTSVPIRSLELRRPSGRPQGKIRIKIVVREKIVVVPPDQPLPPPGGFFNYSSAPIHGYGPSPPPPYATSQYNRRSSYDPYSGYYPGVGGYYSAPPPLPRPYYDSAPGYGVPSGPSAPVDYTVGSSYHPMHRNHGKMELGSGASLGAMSGAFGDMSLREGSNSKDQLPVRGESERTRRSDYADHRDDY